MKKIKLAAAVLALTLCLTGCANSEPIGQSEIPESSAVTEETAMSETSEKESVIISEKVAKALSEQDETNNDDNGK